MLLKDAVLEIGCEELPSSYIRPAIDQMKQAAQAALKEHRLVHEPIAAYYTPRRLTLFFKGLAEMQQEVVKEVTGPLVSVAFDVHGLPTRAGEGFAKAQGVSAAALKKMETPKGEVVVAIKKVGGRLTSEILSEIFPEIVKKIRFPKAQRWGNGDFLFARPIRWVCAVFSRTAVPFEVAGLFSGRETFGLRSKKLGPLDVIEAGDYLEVLRQGGVIADPKERRELVWGKIREVAAEKGARVVEDPELLDDVNNLVEAPEAILGAFDPSYLELPDEVIVTAMREHQKYFSARDAEGKLLPYFIGVINGNPMDKKVVVRANEGVLKARLEDAKFFVAEDLKLPLEAWGEKLSGITWLEGMGTLADKSARLSKLAKKIGELCGAPKETIKIVESAALLAKADLATNIIREKEFNSLQGYMGGYYAARQGKEAVGRAIAQHYYPRFSGDALPSSPEASLLSVVDKIDTIAGCFRAGLVPSGSQDPFALRRQALGVIQVILEHKYPVSLENLIQAGQKQYGGKAKSKELQEISAFLNGRLQAVLESKGLSYDVVNAVVATETASLADLVTKAQAVQKLKSQPDFQKLAEAAGRVLRILPEKKITVKVVKPLLKLAEEKDLYEKVLFAQRLVSDADQSGESYYEDVAVHLQTLVPAIHAFFEKVMVMDKNAKVRANRLALLKQASEVLRVLCDFRKLVYASENSNAS